jgi:hypothetical protein
MLVQPAGAAATAAVAPPPSTPGRSFAEVLRSHGASAPAAEPARPGPPVPRALAAVERAQARLEAVLSAARSGRTFTAQELLGLQAESYRAVQTVDLATRLVEQGAQSVRQALATPL